MLDYKVHFFHSFFILQVPLEAPKKNFSPFLFSKSESSILYKFALPLEVIMVVLENPFLSYSKNAVTSVPSFIYFFDKTAALIKYFFDVVLNKLRIVIKTISKCCVAINMI